MKQNEYRKLDVELPKQPLIDQRPWLIAGLLFAFIILLFAAFNYYMQY